MNLLYRIRGEMETPRLLLRHWNPLDLEDFLSFAADPEVMLASGATPAVIPAQGETAFRRALWDSGCYAIVLKETGRAIGIVGQHAMCTGSAFCRARTDRDFCTVNFQRVTVGAAQGGAYIFG